LGTLNRRGPLRPQELQGLGDGPSRTDTLSFMHTSYKFVTYVDDDE